MRVEPGWIEAKDAKLSYVNLKLPDPEEPSIADLTYWWTVGRWLACGHIDKRDGAIISIGYHKLEETTEKLGRFAGNDPMMRRTAAQLLLIDKDHMLRKTLYQCGHGAANKRLLGEAFTLPTEQAQALLEGYLAGDGHQEPTRNRWSASSVSKELLLGIAMLAQRVYGVTASIYPGRSAREHVIEGRKVHAKQDWILCFDIPGANRGSNNKPFILDDGAWKKVRSVEPCGEEETWNLRVDEDESYTAEGCVVKNCPLQLEIIERLIYRYTNVGDVVFDPFSGIGSTGVKAIEMGRKYYGTELNSEYFRDSCHYLRNAEVKAMSPTLFDFEGITSGEDGE
jgi:hypothetical protein